MQAEIDAVSGFERGAMGGLQAPLGAPAFECGQRELAARRIGIVDDEDRFSGAGIAHRGREMGSDVLVTEGPERAADDGPRLEIDRVEGQAAAAPEIGGAAEPPRDGDAHRVMACRIDDIGVRQRLRLRIHAVAAGFEDEDRAAEARELERERDADRARADDADIVSGVGEALEPVADHAASSTRALGLWPSSRS